MNAISEHSKKTSYEKILFHRHGNQSGKQLVREDNKAQWYWLCKYGPNQSQRMYLYYDSQSRFNNQDESMTEVICISVCMVEKPIKLVQ